MLMSGSEPSLEAFPTGTRRIREQWTGTLADSIDPGRRIFAVDGSPHALIEGQEPHGTRPSCGVSRSVKRSQGFGTQSVNLQRHCVCDAAIATRSAALFQIP